MPVTIHLKFEGDLATLLQRSDRAQPVTRHFPAWTRVQTIIESCGVPPVEVDLIVVDGQPAGFDTFICDDAHITLLPPHLAPSVFVEHRLQPPHADRFVADGRLGNLTRNLRLLGLDVAYNLNATVEELLQTMTTQGRALLTRERALLTRGEVEAGYCPRSAAAEEQTLEVVRRFQVELQPYTRCLRCNGLLHAVEVPTISELSVTVPKNQQGDIRRCATCQHLYSSGTQARQLETTIRRGLSG